MCTTYTIVIKIRLYTLIVVNRALRASQSDHKTRYTASGRANLLGSYACVSIQLVPGINALVLNKMFILILQFNLYIQL